jgi:Mrp family chromosome partitioning ATPase
MSAALVRAFAALEQPVQAVWSALASRRGSDSQRRVLFTSPRHGDGTTTLAACSALGLCRNLRTEVALVEANPFRPALAAYTDAPATPGFAEVLRGEEDGAPALRESFEPGLSVLPGGALRASEPLDWRGQDARRLLEEGLRAFPFALIDAPPLLDRPVGRLLFEFADLVVLVVRAGSTTKTDARAALQILRDSGVPLAGVILNRFRKPLPFL